MTDYPTAVMVAAPAALGTVSELHVLHDGRCRLLAAAGPCDCTPVVTAGVVLWRRASRKAKWAPVGCYATEMLAYGAMRGGADYLILPTGQEP
jgi:hypothetical protein